MTCSELIELIEAQAIALWGDRYFPMLIKTYVAIANDRGAQTTIEKKKANIRNAIAKKSCSGETLLILMEAVGFEIKMPAVVRGESLAEAEQVLRSLADRSQV